MSRERGLRMKARVVNSPPALANRREQEAPPREAQLALAKPACARQWSRTWQRTIVPWLFLLPLLLLNGVVVLAPSLGSALYAFTEWSGIGDAKYVGLANFQRMRQDRVLSTDWPSSTIF